MISSTTGIGHSMCGLTKSIHISNEFNHSHFHRIKAMNNLIDYFEFFFSTFWTNIVVESMSKFSFLFSVDSEKGVLWVNRCHLINHWFTSNSPHLNSHFAYNYYRHRYNYDILLISRVENSILAFKMQTSNVYTGDFYLCDDVYQHRNVFHS